MIMKKLYLRNEAVYKKMSASPSQITEVDRRSLARAYVLEVVVDIAVIYAVIDWTAILLGRKK